jgi:hypothetical protein
MSQTRLIDQNLWYLFPLVSINQVHLKKPALPIAPFTEPRGKTKIGKIQTQTKGKSPLCINENYYPPLISPSREDNRPEASTQSPNSENLLSDMCLFMLNMLALEKVTLPPQKKSDVASEITSTYLSKEILAQAEARFTQIMNKYQPSFSAQIKKKLATDRGLSAQLTVPLCSSIVYPNNLSN